MKVEIPNNGSGTGAPTHPVSESLPEWSTSWSTGDTPAPTTPISEQARVPSQGYEANPTPVPQYAPTAHTPAPPTPPAPYASTLAPQPRDRANEASGLIWPILLVTAGIVLFLNTMGVLSWAVWEGIARLWPLALIFFGLDLIVARRSRVGSWIIAGLLVLTIGVLSTTWSVLPWTSSGLAQRSFFQPLSGATSARVEIGLGLGELTISPLDNPGDRIVQGEVALGNGETLRRDYTVDNGVGRLTLANAGTASGWFGGGIIGPRSHDIRLNPTLPMDLKVNGGAGETTLNLAQFNLRRLEVNSGVGKVEVTLPARGTSDVYLNGGVGETIVTVPEGTALRVQVSQGLGSTNVPPSYTEHNEVFTSPGYDSAANRVNMQVKAGIGSLTVRDMNR